MVCFSEMCPHARLAGQFTSLLAGWAWLFVTPALAPAAGTMDTQVPMAQSHTPVTGAGLVSQMDHGAEAFLGQPWECPDEVPCPQSPQSDFLPVFRPLCFTERVEMGFV